MLLPYPLTNRASAFIGRAIGWPRTSIARHGVQGLGIPRMPDRGQQRNINANTLFTPQLKKDGLQRWGNPQWFPVSSRGLERLSFAWDGFATFTLLQSS